MYLDPHEQTASDDETDTIQTLHVGDQVQIVGADPHAGEFGNVIHVDYAGNPSIQLVFDPRGIGAMGYFRREVKLIRAAEKPGWERYGMVRHIEKWRMWKGEIGWTAVQPYQCEKPLFPTGYGYGSKNHASVFIELALAIAKGEAELHLQEALQ